MTAGVSSWKHSRPTQQYQFRGSDLLSIMLVACCTVREQTISLIQPGLLIADLPQYENPRVDYCSRGIITRSAET